MFDYSVETIYKANEDDNRVVSGNRVSHNNSDSGASSIYIDKDGRCPKPWCVCQDIQCVHKLVVNRRFILDKWSKK